eukprot:Hpha_TRINITY_DN2530_c0_g1::TRINITY_DN2530_c0_g1_i1::g.1272::m.1272/K03283/HSPA1s; heat shock 70kDa protein 1/2/6/8
MTAIGISVGCDAICLAAIQDGKPTVIVNQQGHRTTPATVAFTEDEAVVGETAVLLSLKRPREVAQNVPLLLSLSPEEAQKLKLVGEVIEKDGKLVGANLDGPGEKSMSDLVSALLRYMKQEAEAFLGEQVEQCTLAVSEAVAADEHAVQLLTAAAQSVSLRVTRVLRAAPAALLGKDGEPAEGRHLVVDFGGRNLCVSALEVKGGLIQVLASRTARVGGYDVDKAVAKHFADEFTKKTKIDLADEPKAMRRLIAASEATKKTLSQRAQGRLECEALAQGMDFNSTLSKGRFDLLLGPIVRSMRETVEAVLEEVPGFADSEYSAMLIGGTAHIGKVKNQLEGILDRDVIRPSAPEEVTALGAAVQAAVSAKGAVGLPTPEVWEQIARGAAGKAADPSGVRCEVRVAAASLGVRTPSGVQTLVPAGSLLPFEGSWECALPAEQSSALIEIVQGESDSTICRLGLRDASGRVKVTARALADGSVSVTASDSGDKSVVAEIPATNGTHG